MKKTRFSEEQMVTPRAINQVWAYDFVFDTCADGRALKCLIVVEEFTRECLAIDVAGSINLGLSERLRRSLGTTNPVESLLSRTRQVTLGSCQSRILTVGRYSESTPPISVC